MQNLRGIKDENMPLVKATLGTSLVVGPLRSTRVGERKPAVSVDVGGGRGVIEFPLDHFVLAARRVRAKGAAVYWAAAVDAAWQLAGGAALGAHLFEEAVGCATRVLARFATAPKAVSVEVRVNQWYGDWTLEATTDEPIPPFTTERYTPKPIHSQSAWLRRIGDIAVGDRVHASEEIDSEVTHILHSRPGYGIYVWLRTGDGRIISRRGPELRLADPRDVTVVIGDIQHTLTARMRALQGDDDQNRHGVASLRLSHSGCACEPNPELTWADFD
jgi:hypothetical protein